MKQMNGVYVMGLKESIEFWKEMIPNKEIHLLDLDKLVTIMRRYYVMYPRKELQKQDVIGGKSE